jgi:hypothetical protein
MDATLDSHNLEERWTSGASRAPAPPPLSRTAKGRTAAVRSGQRRLEERVKGLEPHHEDGTSTLARGGAGVRSCEADGGCATRGFALHRALHRLAAAAGRRGHAVRRSRRRGRVDPPGELRRVRAPARARARRPSVRRWRTGWLVHQRFRISSECGCPKWARGFALHRALHGLAAAAGRRGHGFVGSDETVHRLVEPRSMVCGHILYRRVLSRAYERSTGKDQPCDDCAEGQLVGNMYRTTPKMRKSRCWKSAPRRIV